MRVVIQKVQEASVTIDTEVVGDIGPGLMVFVGIIEEDSASDIDWLARKILNLRLFNDENGVMNQSLLEVDGQLLLISQFTLHASTKKGNRPSYLKAARPETAIPLYEALISALQEGLGKQIETGRFGQQMEVRLWNDGPVTITIDTKNKE